MALIFGDRTKGPYYDSEEPFVLFECKHESKTSLVVNAVYYQVKFGLGVGLCPECEAQRQKTEELRLDEERVIKSVASALEEGFRPIQGQREQVEDAEKIRAGFLLEFKKQAALLPEPLYTEQEREDLRELLSAVRTEVSEQIEATWWLNAKHKNKPGLFLIDVCQELLGRLKELEPEGSDRFGDYACKHRNTFYPFGPLQKKLCAVCHGNSAPKPNKDHKLLTVTAQIKAGLASLEGSEKQIVWAEKIREKLFYFLLMLEKKNTEGLILKKICQEANSQARAKWWIDQQNRDRPDMLYQNIKSMLETGAPMPRKDGLPELEGTEAQVAWAEQIRRAYIEELSQREKAATTQEAKDILEIIRRQALEQIDSGEWIAQAYAPPADILSSLYEYLAKRRQ